jgi:hypothetical protein
MRILIGTPAHGYEVTADYHASVFRLARDFARRRPEIELESKIIGLSLLTMNRNVLANLVLQDQSYTHLLFIDADMAFDPGVIERMVDFNEPVVAVLPPSKKRNLDRMLAAAAAGQPRERAIDAGVSYIGTPLSEGGRIEVRGDFLRVAEAGTGIMLIRRDALERLREACPELWSDDAPGRYRPLGLNGVLQLFETYAAPNGLYYGEDVAFCRRWIERCDGAIWACWNAEITHVGRERVTGNFKARMPERS